MRAAIELPAVAIFTIVAGSLIILFFVLLTQSQGKQAESSTQARSLQFLDTLLKSAATSRGTSTNVTAIDNTIFFSCDETGMSFGYQGGAQLPIYNTIIFSPSKLIGGQLKAATLASDIPYRALNILYLKTDQNIIYYTPDAADIIAGAPFEMTSNTNPPPDQRNVMTPDSTSIRNLNTIVITKDNANEGKVTYPGGGVAYYPTRELLFGAMLAPDEKAYDCEFNAYLDQIKFVNRVMWQRAETLKALYLVSDPCWSKYQTDGFGMINNLPRAEAFQPSDSDDFQLAISKIEFVNQDLLTGDNCVSLY